MKYDAYISSPAWRGRRERFFFEHRRICQSCRTRTGTLELHHISYAHIGDERDDELAALCDHCHEKVHNSERDLLASKRVGNRAEAIRFATTYFVRVESRDTVVVGGPVQFYIAPDGTLAFREDTHRDKKIPSLGNVMKDIGL